MGAQLPSRGAAALSVWLSGAVVVKQEDATASSRKEVSAAFIASAPIGRPREHSSRRAAQLLGARSVASKNDNLIFFFHFQCLFCDKKIHFCLHVVVFSKVDNFI